MATNKVSFLHDRAMSVHHRAYEIYKENGEDGYNAFCHYMQILAKRDNDQELTLKITCQQIWNTAKQAIKAGMSKHQAFPLTGDKS